MTGLRRPAPKNSSLTSDRSHLMAPVGPVSCLPTPQVPVGPVSCLPRSRTVPFYAPRSQSVLSHASRGPSRGQITRCAPLAGWRRGIWWAAGPTRCQTPPQRCSETQDTPVVSRRSHGRGQLSPSIKHRDVDVWECNAPEFKKPRHFICRK